MATKYLDKTGLAYFWSKLKAVFAVKSHVHGSITSDGKLGTASRAVVTDGNKAIGVSSVTAAELGCLSGVTSAVQTQLDAKAADSNAVHKNGDTMTGALNIEKSAPTIILNNTDIVKGTYPTENKYSHLQFSESSGTATKNRLGVIENQVSPTGLVGTIIRAYRNVADTTNSVNIAVYYDTESNLGYGVAPNPPSGDRSTKIATTQFVGDEVSSRVDLTTEQTVKGVKSFYGAEMDTYPEFGYNYNHSLILRGLSRRDTFGKSCGFLKRYRQNTAQGASNNSNFSFGIQENSTWLAQVFIDLSSTVSSSAINSVFSLNPFVQISGSNDETVTINKNLGSSSYPWDNVYANSGPWSGSDARMKDDIETPPEELLDAWQNVEFKVFKFKDAKSGKGSGARIHVGVVAQDVQKALASKGLDAGRYGFFGYDRWDAKYEDGSLVQDAGDKYSIRYEEALALECACLRRRVAMLEKRMAALEESSRA